MLAKHDDLDAGGNATANSAFRRCLLLQTGMLWVISLPLKTLVLIPDPSGVGWGSRWRAWC